MGMEFVNYLSHRIVLILLIIAVRGSLLIGLVFLFLAFAKGINTETYSTLLKRNGTIRVYSRTDIAGPFTYGIFYPVIMIPERIIRMKKWFLPCRAYSHSSDRRISV